MFKRFGSLLSLYYSAILICCAASAAEAGERFALLIGNSRYEQAKPLRNPENDVDLISKSLKSTGFKTFTSLNVGIDEMRKAADAFIAEVKEAHDPVILIFFAGHGVQVGDKNFLIAVDAGVGSAEEVAGHSLDAADLLKRVNEAGPRLTMLVLDACRDDPFDNRTRGLGRGLTRMTAESGERGYKNQLIAFSTSPGTVALDGEAGTSPYASAFAETVLVPGLHLEAAFRRIRQKVVERTNGKQEPWENSALYEEFHFVSDKAGATLSPEQATVWDLASMVNSAEAYQRYVDRYPSGMFAALARDKIAAINRDFAYVRKAELFPIVQYTRFELPVCGRTEDPDPDGDGILSFDNTAYEKMFDTFGKLNGQLAYIDLSFPLPTLFCGSSIQTLNYGRVTEIGLQKNTCYKFPDTAPAGKTMGGANVRCVEPKNWGDAPGAKSGTGWPDGGVSVQLSVHYRVEVPYVEASYYGTTFDYPEGQWTESSLVMRGLVRVEISGDDGFLIARLAPVDPREIGMTWKFDNTAGKAKEMSRAKQATPEWQTASDAIGIPTGEEDLPPPHERAGGPPEFESAAMAPIDRGMPDAAIPVRTYWNHNGSIVYLESDGPRRRFFYEKPRPGMIEAGASTGTLLFDGTTENKLYQGKAYVFNRVCGRAAYAVTGPILDDGKRVVIQGKAPRVTKSCKVSGYINDTLEFIFMPELSGAASR